MYGEEAVPELDFFNSTTGHFDSLAYEAYRQDSGLTSKAPRQVKGVG